MRAYVVFRPGAQFVATAESWVRAIQVVLEHTGELGQCFAAADWTAHPLSQYPAKYRARILADSMHIPVRVTVRYTWTGYSDGRVTEYCADGDGFVRVSVNREGTRFRLFDQIEYCGLIDAENIAEALRVAEAFADSAHPGMLGDT